MTASQTYLAAGLVLLLAVLLTAWLNGRHATCVGCGIITPTLAVWGPASDIGGSEPYCQICYLEGGGFEPGCTVAPVPARLTWDGYLVHAIAAHADRIPVPTYLIRRER